MFNPLKIFNRTAPVVTVAELAYDPAPDYAPEISEPQSGTLYVFRATYRDYFCIVLNYYDFSGRAQIAMFDDVLGGGSIQVRTVDAVRLETIEDFAVRMTASAPTFASAL